LAFQVLCSPELFIRETIAFLPYWEVTSKDKNIFPYEDIARPKRIV
jgi:hypothetical protein